jgi:putative phosphonate metabolism protein
MGKQDLDIYKEAELTRQTSARETAVVGIFHGGEARNAASDRLLEIGNVTDVAAASCTASDKRLAHWSTGGMMNKSDRRRYALYYTPPREHPLSQAVAQWLGRDVFARDEPLAGDRSNDDVSLTAEPRRYGFHATLKAPFRLAPGRSRQELECAIRRFVDRRQPCPIGSLQVAMLGDFFALVPRATPPSVRDLASQVTSQFDQFRARMTAEELQRRLRTSLDETEMRHVEQWGYPYVFERFRFHMTLTGPVAAGEREGVAQRLEKLFQPLLDETFHIDAITLFEQEIPETDFVATSRFGFQPLPDGGRAG